ncbi:hypothetical protein BLJAPNOD_05601 [Ensifer sp. M14]|jgi:hypothetical protein|nr:hypothetical protein BLJAPNOD_05601 [Ensifer sp. M14]
MSVIPIVKSDGNRPGLTSRELVELFAISRAAPVLKPCWNHVGQSGGWIAGRGGGMRHLRHSDKT